MILGGLLAKDNSIDIETFRGLDFDNFKKSGDMLTIEHSKEISSYYETIYNHNNPPYYHCLPIYNTITNTHNYKYLVINVNNDKVMIVFKVVQFMTTHQIKIFDKPISLGGVKDNETQVLNILMSMPFVKILCKETYLSLYGEGDLSIHDCDSYYERTSMEAKYNEPGYITKNLFRRFDNPDFKVEISKDVNLKELFALRDIWQKSKEEMGVAITTRIKDFEKIMTNVLAYKEKFLHLNIWYKGTLVCVFTYIVYDDNTLINIYRTSLSRTAYGQDDSWLRNTLSRVDGFATYYTFKTLPKLSTIYWSGTNPTNKTLQEYKQIHSSGRISYYVVRK